MNELQSWEKGIKRLVVQKGQEPPEIWDLIQPHIGKPKRRKSRIIFWTICIFIMLAGSVFFIRSDPYAFRDGAKSTGKIHDKDLSYVSNTSSNSIVSCESNENKETGGVKANPDMEKIGSTNKFPTRSAMNPTYVSTRSTQLIEEKANILNPIKNRLEKHRHQISKRISKPKTFLSADQSLVKHADKAVVNRYRDNFSGFESAENPYNEPDDVDDNAVTLSMNRGYNGYDATEKLRPLSILIKQTEQKISTRQIFQAERRDIQNRANLQYYLEIETSLGYPLKKLSGDHGTGNLEKLHSESGSPWYSWGGAAHFGLLYQKRWSLSTGINFTQIKDKFDYLKGSSTRLVITIDTVNGVAKKDTQVLKVNHSYRGETRYSLIDVPVSIGYQKNIKNWTLGVQCGVMVNVLMIDKGFGLDKLGNVVRLEENDNIHKTRVGLGFSLSFMAQKSIFHNTSIYIKPEYRAYLNDWNTQDYPVKMKRQNLVVSLGIRHLF